MIPIDSPEEETPQGPSINEDGTFNRPEEPPLLYTSPRPAPSSSGSGCGLLFLGGFFLLLALFLYTLFS